MFCAIWYHLPKAFKFTKSNTRPWVFSRFVNCTNGPKSRKASHIQKKVSVNAGRESSPCIFPFERTTSLKFWINLNAPEHTKRSSQPANICSKLTIEIPEQGDICSKLTIKTSERRQWRRSYVFIVNFEHISHLALVFLLLTLSK